MHSQSWCEERITEILDNLKGNVYPTIAYGEVLRPLLILESMGFDKRSLDDAKQLMIANIEKADHPQAPNDHLVVFEDIPDRVLRAKQVLTEIQNAVAERNSIEKELSLDEILKQEDWVDQLTPFVERHNLKDDPYGTVFSSVDSEIWVALLNDASPEVLTKFRHWFHWVYPTNLIHQNRQRDIEVLKTIVKEIDPDKADDLIVKSLRRWLKIDIEKVCSLYSQGGQQTTLIEENETIR